MAIERKILYRQAIEIILIFTIGGLLNAFLACPACFSSMEGVMSNPDRTFRIWAFSGVMWVLLWKGNELISCQADKYISWVREPVKRFLIGVISMLLYTVSAVLINTYVFSEFVFKGIINTSFSVLLLPVMLYSVGVTIFIMIIFLSAHFLKAWRQSAINEEKLLRENITSQYEALKNQVNPHFLFNTLNALSSLIYEDRDKAVEFIHKFSEVYRYVLDSKDKEVVPLNDEIDFARSYIYLLHSRYEKNLEIVVDEDLPPGFVPPMSVQMLVENAIKHNVISDDSPIRIRISRDGFNIRVENNIRIKPNGNTAGGLGIENIKSRYSILTDHPVIIKNNGAVYSISIPVLEFKNE